MTPVKQLNRHDPANGVWGDCFRACIASLLDIETDDIPHVLDKGVEWEKAKPKMLRFLDRFGLTYVAVPFDPAGGLQGVFDLMERCNPGVFYMIVGRSKTGCNHVVIAQGGRIVHDPSLNQSGIIGPCEEDGLYWVEFLVRK